MNNKLKIILSILLLGLVLFAQFFLFNDKQETNINEFDNSIIDESSDNNSNYDDADSNSDIYDSNSDDVIDDSFSSENKYNLYGTRWKNVYGDIVSYIDFMPYKSSLKYQRIRIYKDGEVSEYASTYDYKFSDDGLYIIFSPGYDDIYRSFQMISEKKITINNKEYIYDSVVEIDL